mgnify:CR=1 FL=1
MTQKDLAEEYLDRKIKQEPFKSLTKGFEYAFSVDDIKAAFNAGRESVVENIPELDWKDDDVTIEGEFALCPVGRYEVVRWDEFFKIWRNPLFLGCRPSLSEAKQAANEDYKERIKQALGL